MRDGWEIKKISDVCIVISGQSPEGKYYNKDGEGLPFYQGKKEFTKKTIGKPKTWTTKVTKEAFEGDILMSVRAPVGPVNLCQQHSCIGRGLAAIRSSDKIDNDYLFNFLVKYESEIVGNSGAVFNSINKTQISNIEIPIPPTKEQKEIVEILDQAFESIDKAKANIEKNIENAKDLFQSKLNQILSQTGEGWRNKKIEEVCQIISGGTPKTSVKEYWTGGIPWITPADMGKLVSREVSKTRREISKLGLEKSSAKLFPENSVILSTRAPIGHLAINSVPMSTNQGCRGLIVSSEIESCFLYYFLLNNKNLLNDLGTGTTFKELSRTVLGSVKINLPRVEKQKEIVETLDIMDNHIQSLLASYEDELKNLEELKKSILQKAFSGELTNKSFAA